MKKQTLLLIAIAFISISNLNAQVTEYWGMTRYGGEDGAGTIFKIDENGENLDLDFSFELSSIGKNPYSLQLCQANNGKLYGFTYNGGSRNKGALFEYDPQTGIFTDKQSLDGRAFSSMLLAENGKLYCIIDDNADDDGGFIYEFDPQTNTFTNVYTIGWEVGEAECELIQGSDGYIYGMSAYDDVNGFGTIFQYNIESNSLNVLHRFNGTDGAYPSGNGLVEGADGLLYGLTHDGGVSDYGVIFKYNLETNTYTKLHDFDGTNGRYPNGCLTQTANGNLYGTTRIGGSISLGVLFEFNIADSVFANLVNFRSPGYAGKEPKGILVEIDDNVLFGCTARGNSANYGVLFEYDITNDTYTKRKEIAGSEDGESIIGLSQVSNGNIYGMTYQGGSGNGGVLFEYSIDANTYTKKVDFKYSETGAFPYGTLLQANNDKFYGTTTAGGPYDLGTIFEYDPVLKTQSALASFNGTIKQSYAQLIQESNDILLGLALGGGANYLGCIYEFNLSNNTITKKKDFSSSAGSKPQGSFFKASNGNYYAHTYTGGSNNKGVLFEYIYATNTYTKKVNFYDSNGANPIGDVIEGVNGVLYGLTNKGGTDGLGVMYKYNLNSSTYTKLHDFDGTTGSNPQGSLVHVNGKLYGLTSLGGANDMGVLFEYDTTTNVYSVKKEFDGTNSGAKPYGTLVLASNGKLYGYTYEGGANNLGVQFEYDPSTNTFTKQADFDGNNGSQPFRSKLIETSMCHISHQTINVAVCETYTVPSGDETYTAPGSMVVYDTLTNQCGLDSILTINLSINNNTGVDTQTACNSFVWIDGNTYTESNNTATFTVTNVAGCDSVVTLNLTMNNSSTGTDIQTACDAYTWIDGNTYTESNNTATHALTNAVGCDSVVTLNLTILKSTSGTDTQTACDSYTWIDGNVYTGSNNTATHTLTNAAGCDSVVTLNLTIKNSTSGTDVQSSCEPITWIDGNTYTESNNTATHTLTNAAGCDSLVTLNLTILESTTGVDTQIACESFEWIDGNVYTESNHTATYTLTNAVGCDSVVTLNLTINNSTTGIDTQTACGSFTWIDGNTYTESNNTATHTLSNAIGCDSLVTLNLTILKTSTAVDTQTACDTFEWIDGNVYTESNNTATYTITNTLGCDSVVTLNLTILESTSGIDTQVACGSFTWIDGNTYTESNNTATHTLTNTVGCDSVVTLNLTIVEASTGIDIQISCGAFTWIDGNVYTESNNTAIYTLTNTAGCDSVVTLNLTINESTTGVDVQNACGSYTWIDGNTYTENNNTATHTLINAEGCDSVVTLNLTILESSTGIDTQTACNSFEWIDGNVYTESNNTAMHTLTNAAGCDSVVTLNLTINQSVEVTVSDEVACDSYTAPDGVVYTSSGIYTAVLTTATGCDSIITIHLTIPEFNLSVDNTNGVLQSYDNDANYQWINLDSNKHIEGAVNQGFEAKESGNYAVILTKYSCSDTSDRVNVIIDPVSINEVSSLFNIYPNPAKTEFAIYTDQSGDLEMRIYDINGTLVLYHENYIAGGQVNIYNLNKGAYIVSLKGTNNISHKRLIIK